MRFQLIVTPSMKTETHYDAPYGALYIASSLREEGHDVQIVSGDIENIDYKELAGRIREYKPDAIGISSVIVTSYKYVKGMTLGIKKEFHHIPVIVGGGLGAAAETVLDNSGTDIVVIGEGDITIKELARKIQKGEPYEDVAGIAFKRNGIITKTPPRPPIKDLDILRYPAFDLIDMSRYFIDVKRHARGFQIDRDVYRRLFVPKRSRHMLRIMISRGCVNRCSFCYRPTPGLRHFSFPYIFDYIEYVMDRYNINVFSFGDECFAPDKAWNRKFLEELRKRKLDIMFQIMGMRVDAVDYDILRSFKDAGCFTIFYGFESGSQKMLDIMNKKVTVEQNLEVAEWTKKAGITTVVNLLFGMPGETTDTIRESIGFLKKLDCGMYNYQYAYAYAVPATPLYDYAKMTGLIPSEDEYLENLIRATLHDIIDTDVFINFTSEDISTIKGWARLLKDELLMHNSINKIMYLSNKYLRPKAIHHSLKTLGFKNTLKEIWKRIFKRRENLASTVTGKLELVPSSQREIYLSVLRRFVEMDEKGMSLMQIIERIKAEASLMRQG
jgi:anaerobic magnesium-protoporphyrin IX monomethyl ester cyclase